MGFCGHVIRWPAGTAAAAHSACRAGPVPRTRQSTFVGVIHRSQSVGGAVAAILYVSSFAFGCSQQTCPFLTSVSGVNVRSRAGELVRTVPGCFLLSGCSKLK